MIKSALFVLSLLGLTYQLYKVIDLYLRYETINQVRIRFPDYIRIPELAICHWPASYLSSSLAQEVDRRKGNNQLTTEFLLELQPQFASMFTYCTMRDDKTPDNIKYTGADCARNLNLTRFVKNYLVCNCMKPSYATRIDRKVLGGAFAQQELMYLKYIANDTMFYMVFVRPENSEISDRTTSTLLLKRQLISEHDKKFAYMKVDVSYVRTVTQLLPAPFDTNCVDYATQHGCRSRQQCLDKCLANKSLSIAGIVHSQVSTNETTYFKNKLGQLSPKEVNARVIIECEEQFNVHECHQETIATTIVTHKFEHADNVITISLIAPAREDIISIAQPSINFEEFIPLCLSLISFWFGLSPFTIDETFASILNRFGNKSLTNSAKLNRRRVRNQRVEQQRIDRIVTKMKRDVSATIHHQNQVIAYLLTEVRSLKQ